MVEQFRVFLATGALMNCQGSRDAEASALSSPPISLNSCYFRYGHGVNLNGTQGKKKAHAVYGEKPKFSSYEVPNLAAGVYIMREM